jgi:NADPH:quinone reductase-like Zn-dependent oxidoreductase
MVGHQHDGDEPVKPGGVPPNRCQAEQSHPDQENAVKAIVQSMYGSADVLELVDIDKPVVGDNDVLLRVHAASLHVGDWHVMTGLPYMLRVVGFGLRKPIIRVRGTDVAGTVEAVGTSVSEFRPGDAVFGTCEGAFAEYARAPEKNLALKPVNLSLQQAAAVPTSAFAALQALRNRGEIQSGHKVLVVGATGGVGVFAVQIAKAYGAHVTGVCSTGKMELVRSLGADEVVDYTAGDFTRTARRYDIVLDTGGNRALGDLRRLLSPRGTLVLVGGEGGNRVLGGTGKWIQALVIAPFVGQKLRPLSTAPNKQDLLLVKHLIESGRIMPVIDRAFALVDVPDAFRYLKKGNGRGKIVITV